MDTVHHLHCNLATTGTVPITTHETKMLCWRYVSRQQGKQNEDLAMAARRAMEVEREKIMLQLVKDVVKQLDKVMEQVLHR